MSASPSGGLKQCPCTVTEEPELSGVPSGPFGFQAPASGRSGQGSAGFLSGRGTCGRLWEARLILSSLLLPRARAVFLLSSQDLRAPGGNPNSVSSDIPSSPGLSAGRVLGKKQSIFCRKIFSYNLTRKTHHVQDLVKKNAESSDFFRWLSIAPHPFHPER